MLRAQLPTLPSRRVMIVSPDAHLSEKACEVFRREGADTVTVVDMKAAVQIVTTVNIAAIVCDSAIGDDMYKLGKCLDIIRERRKIKNPFLWILSPGEITPADVAICGAEGVFKHPYSWQDIADTIAAFLKKVNSKTVNPSFLLGSINESKVKEWFTNRHQVQDANFTYNHVDDLMKTIANLHIAIKTHQKLKGMNADRLDVALYSMLNGKDGDKK